ncbi:hypothetical protein M0R45_008164 [Rubus argutus]|uniref:Uncharacterized protein n=1 Tax=Rubus argutus TaxID=59490 RepID=A0AAW1Y0S6_RUBAR
MLKPTKPSRASSSPTAPPLHHLSTTFTPHHFQLNQSIQQPQSTATNHHRCKKIRKRMRNEEKTRTDPRKKEMKKWTCPAEPVPNPCSGRLTHDDAVSLQVAAAIHYKPRRCRQPQTKPSPSEDEKEDEMTERRMKTRFRKEGVRAGKKEKK